MQQSSTYGIFLDDLSASQTVLLAEAVASIAEEGIATVLPPPIHIIDVVPPEGFAQIRYLCKRLRVGSPTFPIIVGCWICKYLKYTPLLCPHYPKCDVGHTQGALMLYSALSPACLLEQDITLNISNLVGIGLA